jgi:hypothetical protein
VVPRKTSAASSFKHAELKKVKGKQKRPDIVQDHEVEELLDGVTCNHSFTARTIANIQQKHLCSNLKLSVLLCSKFDYVLF